MSVFSYIRHYPLASLEIFAIWVVCMIPVPDTPLDNIRFIDKWTHFVMYGSLTLVIWCEYMYHHHYFHSQEWLSKHNTGLLPVQWSHLLTGGLLLPVIQGGLIELAQAYLTTCRSGDWLDFLCNSLGALLGSGMGYLLMAVRQRQ